MEETSISNRVYDAMGDMANPSLDGVNPHFKSRYVTLANTLAAVNPALRSHGLALVQRIEPTEAGTALITEVRSRDGETLEMSTVPITLGSDPQKTASYITYMRRISILTAFCLVGDDDDDGNTASGKQTPADRPFKVRCRTCGRERMISSHDRYAVFLASDEARCCSKPDWAVVS